MKSSAVPWDVRYQYFTKGWVNNWGFGNYDGWWGLSYMRECDGGHFIPGVAYYQVNGEAGGSESAFLAKVQNATTMKGYFGDFKLLMQRAKDFGKPVIVLMEADGFGFLEQQTGGNSAAYAAVKDSGLPELAGLPNTVAGWGLAFLQLRKSVGATNAVLGIHISALGERRGHRLRLGDGCPAAAGRQGLRVPVAVRPTANVTGATWDFLVGDPLDRDSDYYKLVQGQNRWWDASDTASINSESFNRYAEWVRLWNVKAQKRWILWQIPLGNSNHRDVGQRRLVARRLQGQPPRVLLRQRHRPHGEVRQRRRHRAPVRRRRQRAELVPERHLHRRSALHAEPRGRDPEGGRGVALDWRDGHRWLDGRRNGHRRLDGDGRRHRHGRQRRRRRGAIQLRERDAELGRLGLPRSPASPARRSTHSPARTALAVTVNGAAGDASATVASPSTPAGKIVTFHVWVPSGSAISAIQPFVLQGASGNWTWTGNWQAIGSLKTNAWNTLTVAVPANASALFELGVDVTTSSTWSGTIYVDSVSW